MADEWKKLLDDANLSPEERKNVEASIGGVDKLIDTLNKGVMRQADYSRQTQDLKKERETLQSNWDTANEEYKAMLADNESTKAELEKAKKDRDEAAQKLKDAEEKAKGATVDTSKFLTAEQFEERQRTFAAGQTAYFGRTMKIMREHKALFGSDLDPEEFIQEAIAAKKTPDVYWEEKYNVKAKRKEISDADEKKKLDEAEKRGYEKRLTEEANPNLRQMDASKQPFYEGSNDGKSIQPWDDEQTPQAEADFVNELKRSVGT